jgi:choline kinase
MDITFLAAGMGTRLSKANIKHKCLMKINKKSLMLRLVENALSSKIKNINIITGHNEKYVKEHLKKFNINFIKNKYYKNTNIAYSIYLSLLKSNKKNDLIISYSDIFYNHKLLDLIYKKKNQKILVPILKNWKTVWKHRNESIINDAENLVVKKNSITTIGGKIYDISKVKYQYMGVIFVPKKLKPILIKLIKYNKIYQLDGTQLLNKLINYQFDIKVIKYNGAWYEFDKPKDKRNFSRYIKNF